MDIEYNYKVDLVKGMTLTLTKESEAVKDSCIFCGSGDGKLVEDFPVYLIGNKGSTPIYKGSHNNICNPCIKKYPDGRKPI